MEQTDVLRHVLDVLERCEIEHILVGSWASGAYGEPRFTQDIDFVVQLPREKAALLCAAFGSPPYYASREAIVEAMQRRGHFNIIHMPSGVKVDFSVAKNDTWTRGEMARKRRVKVLPDREGWVASPEDVILSKMLFYQEGESEKHLRDITGILKVQGDAIDRAYIERWVDALDLRDTWRILLRRMEVKPH